MQDRNSTAHVADIVRVARMMVAFSPLGPLFGQAVHSLLTQFQPFEVSELAVLNRVFGMDWPNALRFQAWQPTGNDRADENYRRRHRVIARAMFHAHRAELTDAESARIDSHNARSLPGSV